MNGWRGRAGTGGCGKTVSLRLRVLVRSSAVDFKDLQIILSKLNSDPNL